MTFAEMRRLYVEREMSTAEIGRRANPPVAATTVNRRLRAAGVRIRASHTVRSERARERRDQMLDMRHDLGSIAAVADELGLHQSTVSMLLRLDASPTASHAGIPRRRPAPPAGMLTLPQAALVSGETADRIYRRAVAGKVPGARRETSWPFRWLVPAPVGDAT
jgi:hypothetical protein